MKNLLILTFTCIFSFSLLAQDFSISKDQRLGALVENKKTGDSLYLLCLKKNEAGTCEEIQFALNEKGEDRLIGKSFLPSELARELDHALSEYTDASFVPYSFTIALIVLAIMKPEFAPWIPLVFVGETILLPFELVFSCTEFLKAIKGKILTQKFENLDENSKINKVIKLRAKTFNKILEAMEN